jgi:hypothetical protein
MRVEPYNYVKIYIILFTQRYFHEKNCVVKFKYAYTTSIFTAT